MPLSGRARAPRQQMQIQVMNSHSYLELNGMTPEDLIESVEDLVGPSFLITRGLEVDLLLSF